MTVFDHRAYTEFTYDRIVTSPGQVEFHYSLRGNAPDLHFVETLAGSVLDRTGSAPASRALQVAYLLAGLSYYKTAAPGRVVGAAFTVDASVVALLEAAYRDGLAEYAYRNQLPALLRPELKFVVGSPTEPEPSDRAFSVDALVPMGGGKDSIVSMELIRAAGLRQQLFAVNPNHTIQRVADESGLELVTLRRTLDPQLRELNASGALNGHVPITAIISFLAIAAAEALDCRYVVMSNERSASAPTLTWIGEPVNHQWSKSLAAETMIRSVAADFCLTRTEYFSLLRPLSELAIARAFARESRYDPLFTSCNTVFRLDPKQRNSSWCTNCPKCRFVFLCFAPFMSKDRLVGIFGRDLFADPAQQPGFQELLGIGGARPFECVGDETECRLAARLAFETVDWKSSAMLGELTSQVAAESGATIDDEAILRAGADHYVTNPSLLQALATVS